MELMFHMLYFSGLCLVTQSLQYQYVLIQQMKTWYEAQAYCRQNYIDLATVQTNEDWINIHDAVQVALTGVTWIGLYNNINSWRWSYKEENMTVQYWAVWEPNNYNAIEECVVNDNSTWTDHPCTRSHPFICYNENGNSFILISNILTTWLAAQSYCRQHYTDLATIRNETENDELGLMTEIIPAWIGLYRDSWKWSDETNISISSINWMIGQPDISGKGQVPCGAIGTTGLIEDRLCSNRLPFICSTYSKKQIVKLEMNFGQNLIDSAVMETILQIIKKNLTDHGIKKTILTWRTQSNGDVFFNKTGYFNQR